VNVYSNVDMALLTSKWHNGECPTCRARRTILDEGAHSPGCEHDLALAERSFGTQAERDAARKRLITASGPTLPPPPSTEPA
jgi:hypothetical protein